MEKGNSVDNQGWQVQLLVGCRNGWLDPWLWLGGAVIGNRIADNHRQIWETKRWLSGAFPDVLLFRNVAKLEKTAIAQWREGSAVQICNVRK